MHASEAVFMPIRYLAERLRSRQLAVMDVTEVFLRAPSAVDALRPAGVGMGRDEVLHARDQPAHPLEDARIDVRAERELEVTVEPPLRLHGCWSRCGREIVGRTPRTS